MKERFAYAIASAFAGMGKEDSGKGKKGIIAALLSVPLILIIVIIAPLAAIASIFTSGDGTKTTESDLYNKVYTTLEEKIEQWDEQGTENTYPDVPMCFAYFSVEKDSYDLSDVIYDAQKVRKFYDLTVDIDKNVVCKSIDEIAQSQYPEDEEDQIYYVKCYRYWKDALKDVTASIEDTESADSIINTPSTSLLENQKLSDVDVTVYSTGMAIPHYLQYDEKWGGHSYDWSTIKTAGCGPTCAAMIASYFTQTYITPIDAADYSSRNGYHAQNGTSWSFFNAYMSQYGIACIDLGHDINKVIGELGANRPVIASMSPGTFTKAGHFIVLRGLDENGNIYVNDPNDNAATKGFFARSFSPALILNESKNFWSFTK